MPPPPLFLLTPPLLSRPSPRPSPPMPPHPSAAKLSVLDRGERVFKSCVFYKSRVWWLALGGCGLWAGRGGGRPAPGEVCAALPAHHKKYHHLFRTLPKFWPVGRGVFLGVDERLCKQKPVFRLQSRFGGPPLPTTINKKGDRLFVSVSLFGAAGQPEREAVGRVRHSRRNSQLVFA